MFQPQTDSQTKRQNNTMEPYLRAFVNFKQNDWARLLSIAEFAYNNARDASTNDMSLELNYGHYPWISYKKNINPRPQSKSANKLSAKARELMIVCQKNIHYTQEVQKRAHDKGVIL